MLWFALALTGALAQATYSLSVKVLLRRSSPYPLAGYSFLTASLILFSLVLLTGIPPLGPGLLPAVAVTVTINIIATIFFYRALSITDLSLCVPMLAFTPVFLIFTSFLILGELPSPAGTAGILLVAAGAYVLTREHGHSRTASLLTPFDTLRRDRGVQYMLLVAFLYSISVNYDKEVVMASDPVFASALVLLLLGLAFLMITFGAGIPRRSPGRAGGNTATKPDPDGSAGPRAVSGERSPGDGHSRPLRSVPVPLLYAGVGLVLAVEGIAINTAYTMAIVPYVITIKRLAIFFSVLFGGLILHERHISTRLTGAVVMIAGAIVIGVWG
jgi:drug/metabolite transporter (DMT)-like permease